MISRFTVYRRNISERGTHTELQKNSDDMPQYEGVIFTDGTVVLRWLTASKSTSVWNSLKEMLDIHGHPEYGTYINFHDEKEVPHEWSEQLNKHYNEKYQAIK